MLKRFLYFKQINEAAEEEEEEPAEDPGDEGGGGGEEAPDEDVELSDEGGEEEDTTGGEGEESTEGEEEEEEEIIFYENPQYHLKLFFNKLTKKIKYWFKHSQFKELGFVLDDIEIYNKQNYETMRLNVTFSYKKKYFYIMFISVKVEDIQENQKVDSLFVEARKYTQNSQKLVNVWQEGMKINEFKEKKIINGLNKLEKEARKYSKPSTRKKARKQANRTGDFNSGIY